VTEDSNLDDNIMSNIIFQTYLQSEFNENTLSMLNPKQILSMYYGNATGNNTEANLELLLAAASINQQAFELTVIEMFLNKALNASG